MKTKVNKIFCVLMGLLVTVVGGCSSDEPETEPRTDEPVVNQEQTEEPIPTPEVDWFSPSQIPNAQVEPDEAGALGLQVIAQDDEMFMAKILPERRKTIDMRAGTPDSVVIDLLTAACVRWQMLPDDTGVKVSIKDNTYYSGIMWIYNPSAVDYGPIIAKSLSPTQILIVRKDGDWSGTKPVEVILERQLIGWDPFLPGVYTTLVVELSDTPADSRDTEYSRYITIAEAEEMGFVHIPFDSQEYRAPIVENDLLTVEMPEEGDFMTVELSSPAFFVDGNTHMVINTIDGVSYYDYDANEWLWYPTRYNSDWAEVWMEDPLHVKISLAKFRSSRVDELYIKLLRDDYSHAPDAGAITGAIKVVKPQ